MSGVKQLCMTGHHVRKGQGVVCFTHGNGETKFYGEKRAYAVRAIVDRFNRMQQYKASKQVYWGAKP